MSIEELTREQMRAECHRLYSYLQGVHITSCTGRSSCHDHIELTDSERLCIETAMKSLALLSDADRG